MNDAVYLDAAFKIVDHINNFLKSKGMPEKADDQPHHTIDVCPDGFFRLMEHRLTVKAIILECETVLKLYQSLIVYELGVKAGYAAKIKEVTNDD